MLLILMAKMLMTHDDTLVHLIPTSKQDGQIGGREEDEEEDEEAKTMGQHDT